MNLELMRVIDKTVPGDAFLRRAPDDLIPAQRRSSGKRETNPSSHATDGFDADLSEAQHQQGGKGAQDLPLSVARVALSGGDHGLAHPQGSGLAHLDTLEADFCVEAPNKAIHKFGSPEIMNTDQGSQITSFAWTDRLRRSRVRISMDGKGRFLANIFVEGWAAPEI